LVETNPKIGRVYPQKTMSEEGFMGLDPLFIDSFLAIKSNCWEKPLEKEKP